MTDISLKKLIDIGKISVQVYIGPNKSVNLLSEITDYTD